MTRLRGYDIDGVLVPRNVEPVGDFVIISGRSFKEWDKTAMEVGHYNSPIYLRPSRSENTGWAAAAWKAEMIKRLGVTEFFEDNPQQAELIRGECPGCDVRLVVNAAAKGTYKAFLMQYGSGRYEWRGTLVQYIQDADGNGKEEIVYKTIEGAQLSADGAAHSVRLHAQAIGLNPDDVPCEREPWDGC